MQQKILLYEDEPIIALDLCTQLNTQGYEVLVAADPAEACSLCALHRPELALLNLHASDEPAGQTLSALLQHICPLTIMYISGAREDETPEILALKKAGKILHKPFVTRQLKKFLHKNC